MRRPIPELVGPGAALDITTFELSALCLAALCAGVVDAIAGGGGLVTLPALLAVGLPAHVALGTNKGQSVFGSAASLLRFARSGKVDFKFARLSFPLAFFGSLAGAQLVLFLRPALLRPIVLVLLVAVAAFLAFRRPTEPKPPREGAQVLMALAAFLIAAYDGFFGPGTGTFLIISFVALMGMSLTAGSANAKVVNFASNLAAVALFSLQDKVLWKIALPMAACQFVGSYLGAHLALKGGDRMVRWVVLGVVTVLVLKLLRDLHVG